ncbi:MAG: peroxiredoxin [Thermoanaerobaculales bacterium]|jgi:alkyl hydroperoxide reductase subunit AhpC|nr:peroxiredoxin [Thermoanaerobaculales bacterium]
MTIRVGDKAPNFVAKTTDGQLSLYDYMGDNWVFLFSHPADFTPVCTTELGQVAKMKKEFDKRNVRVLGLSIDSLEDHRRWLKDIESTQGVALNFPVIADPDRAIAERYGMIQGNGNIMSTGRMALVIDPDKEVRLIVVYPESTGRNFNEILRAIDSLRLTKEYGVATPANWAPGDDVIISPETSEKDARSMFPKGYTEHLHYLRTVADPVH